MQNIVIAGFGFMGAMHAQVYAKIRAARVVAVVDQDRARAAAKAAALGMDAPLYADLAEALAKHPADVVDVCLPTAHHAAAVRAAIGAGKSVFCEKPLAPSYPAARGIASFARRTGTRMQVGQCIRFWPEYQALERWTRQGRSGRLLSLSLQRRGGRPGYSAGDWLNDSKLSGGAALDLHVHDTDFVHHLLGPPGAVTSAGTKDATGWSHLFTTYHFADVAVTAEGGWNYPANWGFQMAFQAVFERGAIEFDSNARPTLAVTAQTGRRRPLPFREAKLGRSVAGGGNISALGGYFNELSHFIGCLERGEAPRIATPEQAAESVRTVMAEIRSAETGRTVKLPRGRR